MTMEEPYSIGQVLCGTDSDSSKRPVLQASNPLTCMGSGTESDSRASAMGGKA